MSESLPFPAIFRQGRSIKLVRQLFTEIALLVAVATVGALVFVNAALRGFVLKRNDQRWGDRVFAVQFVVRVQYGSTEYSNLINLTTGTATVTVTRDANNSFTMLIQKMGFNVAELVVMQEKLAALSRRDIPESDRVPHLLFAEEAQNFIGDFESILAETRKFNLVLALATQGIESLTREAVAAIFTNAGTLISFRLSNPDAERLADEFTMKFPGVIIQDLPDYKAWVRTLICDDNGCRPAAPEQVATYPPFAREPGTEWRSRIERTSNERYTKPRSAVESKIAQFLTRETSGTARRLKG